MVRMRGLEPPRPLQALVSKTSVATITPHPLKWKQVPESNRRNPGYEPEWDTASYLHKLGAPSGIRTHTVRLLKPVPAADWATGAYLWCVRWIRYQISPRRNDL